MDVSISNALTDAAVLLGVGMSVVFVFLTLLIGAIHGITAFCKLFPAPVEAEPFASQLNSPPPDEVLQAIRIAVNQYRAPK
jgi:oxaloacetate decarboxylase gamma subunit